MNREEAKALLPFIEAFANGETVQYLSNPMSQNAPEVWEDCGERLFLDKMEYRIKPKPRTFYGIIYEDGSINATPTEKERDELFLSHRNRSKITLVEVLE